MSHIKVRISPRALDAFRGCIEGSYEDSRRDASSIHGDLHGYVILGRHKGLIEVRSQAEAAEVYYHACSSTFQIDDPECDKPYFKTACRIADALREAARAYHPGLITVWPKPSGY